MSRRKIAKKRLINHDPIYNSKLVNMLLSRLLRDGKKSIASKIFYSAMQTISAPSGAGSGVNGLAQPNRLGIPSSISSSLPSSEGSKLGSEQGIKLGIQSALPQATKRPTDDQALQIFQQAILNITPAVEVKSRRIGGANFQVPIEVNAERGTSLALRWLVQAARQRSGREMSTKLANEIMDASNKVGGAIKKKEESLRMAEANRAYASYRF
jgi:small subunit ribosomal protein S7